MIRALQDAIVTHLKVESSSSFILVDSCPGTQGPGLDDVLPDRSDSKPIALEGREYSWSRVPSPLFIVGVNHQESHLAFPGQGV